MMRIGCFLSNTIHIFVFGALVLLSAGAAARADSPDPTNLLPSTVREFLVPSVCVNAARDVTAEDPYACSRGSRKLRFGELLPIRRYNANYSQSADSFLRPIGDDRLPRIVTPFDNRGNAVDPTHREGAFGAYDPLNDGFDVTGVNGDEVSGLGTQAGKGLNLFLNGDCQLGRSWLYFDAPDATKDQAENTDPNGPRPRALISFFDPFGPRTVRSVRTEIISDRNWGFVGGKGCPCRSYCSTE